MHQKWHQAHNVSHGWLPIENDTWPESTYLQLTWPVIEFLKKYYWPICFKALKLIRDENVWVFLGMLIFLLKIIHKIGSIITVTKVAIGSTHISQCVPAHGSWGVPECYFDRSVLQKGCSVRNVFIQNNCSDNNFTGLWKSKSSTFGIENLIILTLCMTRLYLLCKGVQ
jgi:hypothetical protein